MPAFKDLTGLTLGKHRVVEYAGKYKHGGALWKCECLVCGKEYLARGDIAAKPRACSRKCSTPTGFDHHKTTHGLTSRRNPNPDAALWANIKQRCYNPKSSAYYRYGGRGVTMADEWINDMESFVKYVSALPNHGAAGYSLDRIDNDKGYEPGNVRWATKREQMLNTSRNVRVEWEGKCLTLSEWDEAYGYKKAHTITQRYMKGKRGAELFEPVEGRNVLFEYNGESKTLRQWAADTGIAYVTLWWRAKNNKPLF